MRIPLFIYKGKKFTTVEQIEEYENELDFKYYQSDFIDKEIEAERVCFQKDVDLFIFKLLHDLTVLKDPMPPEQPESDFNSESWIIELKESVARLIDLEGWLWGVCEYSEVIDYDLGDSWAEKHCYFNSPFDKEISYCVSYIESPHFREYGDFEFFVARKVLKEIIAYEKIED